MLQFDDRTMKKWKQYENEALTKRQYYCFI